MLACAGEAGGKVEIGGKSYTIGPSQAQGKAGVDPRDQDGLYPTYNDGSRTREAWSHPAVYESASDISA